MSPIHSEVTVNLLQFRNRLIVFTFPVQSGRLREPDSGDVMTASIAESRHYLTRGKAAEELPLWGAVI